jgi:2-polyprenyl-3-methyl-5-hydroxy-6-metoxy-1,4-benzoquinol methylase
MYETKQAEYFGAARTQILPLMPKHSTRVLEIGCGSGQTLEMLKSKGFCDETVGVELFDSAAEEARNRVDKVYCLDVEKGPLPEDLGTFDLILLLDVLEHLVDPWSFLKKIHSLALKPHGKIIISLPNARHFTLVLPLLRGNFDYKERGILDKTHLRFFTRSSATRLIEEAGLTIDAVKSTSLDLNLNSGKLNLITLGLLSGFLTSQYIFSASRMSETQVG